MNYANYDDITAQLSSAGLVIDKALTFDARIQRWQVDGEDRERRGWTKLRAWQSKAGHTYIVGAFGIWHGNDDGYTRLELSKDDAVVLSAEDKAAIREAHKESERKLALARKAEVKKAAQWAGAVWNKCTPCAAHDYISIKQIKPHGLRILPEDCGEMRLDGIDESNFFRLKSAAGALVVPMHDAKGVIQGLQFVYAKGHPRCAKIKRDKEFWPAGMAMGGTFGLIGPVRRDGIALIAEGYATAASLHEATGQTVAYAFSANNLVKAGKELAKACPLLRILFCADDDYLTQGNPGCTSAAAASAEIERSAWIKPEFPKDIEGNDLRAGKKLTDFNDLLVMTGLPLALAEQVNTRLDELKWRDAKPRAESTPQGEGGYERRNAVSIMSLDDAVDRFIPIDDGGGELLFDQWTRKPVKNKQMFALLPSGVRSDRVKEHPVWIERGARYLDQIGFDPAGTDPDVKLNTWGGWPLKPKKGKCDLLLELLEYLCSLEKNRREIFTWLLCWMAYPLQYPGTKMNSAVIMHGPQGTGKSLIFSLVLSKIYGEYSTVLNQRGLEDKFNADWVDAKLFLLAEEVVTRVEMWHIKNELKELVTGEWVRVNGKFAGAYRQRNRINIVYLANEGQPLPLENDDRRHCVVWTPPALGQEFYDQVIDEVDNGGVEAFYDYLLNYDLGGFHHKRRPPDTQAKRNLIELSRSSDERFLIEWIAGDIVLDESKGPLPFCACGTTDLYNAYERWCRQQGDKKPRVLPQFIGSLSRRPGWTNQHRDRFDVNMTSKKRQRIIEPSEADFNAHLKANGADHRQKDEENLTKYATRCFFQFRDALGGQP